MIAHSRMAGGMVLWVVLLSVAGCGGRESSLLLERKTRGPIAEDITLPNRSLLVLQPATQTSTKDGVEVTLTHATLSWLQAFFSNKQVFGAYAGMSPYFMEQIVFYVKIANHSGKKVFIRPSDFAMIDDLGNQYQVLQTDYTTALAESKAPVSTVTRGVIDEARPGYFGVGLPMGKVFAKSQQRFALLAKSSLVQGFLHDGITYDGLIAFWNPPRNAKHLTCLLTNVKTDFNAEDLPQASLEFAFEMDVRQPSK